MKNITCFNLSLNHVASSMAFCQVVEAVELSKNLTLSAQLSGYDTWTGGPICPIPCGFQLTTHFWALGWFIGVGILFCGAWQHTLWSIIRWYEGSTLSSRQTCQASSCHHSNFWAAHCTYQNFLGALFLSWHRKLISVSSVADNTMTGRHSGLVTHLAMLPNILFFIADSLRTWWQSEQQKVSVVLQGALPFLEATHCLFCQFPFWIQLHSSSNLLFDCYIFQFHYLFPFPFSNRNDVWLSKFQQDWRLLLFCAIGERYLSFL